MIKKTRYTIIIICGLLLISFGCKRKAIEIIIENSSNIHDSININVMLDNASIYKNLPVKQGKGKIRYQSINIDFPQNKQDVRLDFQMNNTGEITGTTIFKDSIRQKAVVHVNFLEVRFAKGFELGSRILEKDSVVRREFYSEVIYN